MRRCRSVCVALLLLGAAALPARAQLGVDLPVTIEARLAGAVPTGDFATPETGIGAEVGFGVKVGGRVQLTSLLSAYGFYEYARFGCAECAAVGLESNVVDAGFELGVRGELPFRVRGYAPWASAGVLIGHQLQLSGAEGSAVSEPAIGFSVGAGIQIPLQGSFVLTPGLHYRRYTARFEFATLPLTGILVSTEPFLQELEVSSILVDIGLAYQF